MNLISYPLKYIKPIQLDDGTLIQLRPIHPLDGGRATSFKSTLSEESILARFHGYIPKITKQLVKRLTEIDYETEMAIIAEVIKKEDKEIIAVARIVGDKDNSVDFAIIISDEWHNKRLGSILTDFMLKIAKEMNFKSIYAHVMNGNIAMLEIFRKRGFKIDKADQKTKIVKLKLR